jgi:peptidyl-tRNA hydrolase
MGGVQPKKALLTVVQRGDVVMVRAANSADVAVAVAHAVGVLASAQDAPEELRAMARRWKEEFESWLGVKGPPQIWPGEVKS